VCEKTWCRNIIKQGTMMQPAIPPTGQHHCSSECSHKTYVGLLFLRTSHARSAVRGQDPNQLHKAGTAAVLCALPPIAPPPSGTPPLIKVPHRKKPVQPSGPFSPDVTDLRDLLEAVEGHVVHVIGPVMFSHSHFVEFICEGLPLFCLSGIICRSSGHS